MTGPIDPAQLEGDDLTHTAEPPSTEVPVNLYDTATDEVVAVLDTITDAGARYWATENAATRLADQRGRLAEMRRDAVRELRGLDEATGRPRRTWAEVGELIGTTGTRAQQIAGLEGDRSAPRVPRTQGRPS